MSVDKSGPEVGGVSALKVSGERVFVLKQVEDVDGYPAVLVRRVQVGQEGISHNLEVFRSDELEAIEANLRRELEENVLKGKLQRKLYTQADKDIEAEEATQQASEAQPKEAIEITKAKTRPN